MTSNNFIFVFSSQKACLIAFVVRDFNSSSDKPRFFITSYSPAIEALKNGGSSELTVILTPFVNNFFTG